MKLVKQNKLEHICEELFTEEVWSGRFTILDLVMTKYDRFDKPNQVFNTDETGFGIKQRVNTF